MVSIIFFLMALYDPLHLADMYHSSRTCAFLCLLVEQLVAAKLVIVSVKDRNIYGLSQKTVVCEFYYSIYFKHDNTKLPPSMRTFALFRLKQAKLLMKSPEDLYILYSLKA